MQEDRDSKTKPEVVILRVDPFVTLLSENSGKNLRSRAQDRLYWLLITSKDGKGLILIVSDIHPHGTQALFYVLKHEQELLKPPEGPDPTFLELYRKHAYELQDFIAMFGHRVVGGGFCTDAGIVLELDQSWMTFNFKKTTPVEHRADIIAALPEATRRLLSDEDLDITLH